ncbi:CoF synthetase [Promicromonospora soli]|uniref:Phenylacetate--CoA ligase n=1 Tax=Promicromonospora soli TaxID=2035533 RepID=A0A919KZC6_9MICO|nr:CoF synthetase [Promicromonospora soli]GHH78207.1 phenylacetate--CoA ligase [Promicromonospora soli]
MKRILAFALVGLVDAVVRPLTRSVNTHKLLLGPGIEPVRWWLGRLRAWRTFDLAAREVPAYRAFLAERGRDGRLGFTGSLAEAFQGIPEMDKSSYIKRWSIPERCIGGRLPRRGVVVDESSGSSGTPTSWVRGQEERAATRQLLQVGFARTASTLRKKPFVLNAFSLGAWATGMNVSASLTEVTMIKSCGPDKDKIISTMQEFGTEYTYIITSYPPFLKSLFEDDRLRWEDYDIVAAFGGEGISENMRSHILRFAHSAFGSYGASDLEINLSIETDFTVALRRAIAGDPRLSERLTRTGEYGVLPMIFQFNPFDYLIETNDAGELIVTIARDRNINPRIRYNIHDRGHVLRMRDVLPVLKELGHDSVVDEKFLDLPLLFHYGRSDLSVDYNGAVVGPDALRDVIHSSTELLEAVENHRLISFEDERGDRQLHIALQLTESATAAAGLEQERFRAFVADELRRRNADFHNGVLTAPDGTLPTIAFYGHHSGPFATDGGKLKNEYVWQLPAGDLARWDMDFSHVFSRE